MPAKPDDDTNGAAKTATAPADASKTPASGTPSAATPSFEAVFQSLLAPLQRELGIIRLKIAEISDSSAEPAGASTPSSGESAAPGTTAAVPDELARSVKAILEKLDGKPAAPASAPDNEIVLKALDELHKSQHKELHAVARFLEGKLVKLEEAVRPPPPAAPAPVKQAQPVEADDDEWKEVILGEELCRDSSLAEARTRLFRGVLAGDSAAKSLAGQMMLAQAASAERLPPLMKDVGEAYYRWRPKTAGVSDPLETALATWLKRRCDAGGLGNTIELVIVGDRFDATRHNASERGAEITAVHGWVVLRDNGKVYTKANVSVK